MLNAGCHVGDRRARHRVAPVSGALDEIGEVAEVAPQPAGQQLQVALDGQRFTDDRPRRPFRAHAILGGHLDRIQEDLVQTMAVDRLDRCDRHARGVEIEDQQREPLGPFFDRAGAAEQPEVVGVMGVGGPALLAADDVAVGFGDGARAESGEVAPCLWLGVAEREAGRARGEAGQVALSAGRRCRAR